MSASVVHVVRSDAFAGVERYIADTASELARRGWAVSVIGGKPAAMRSALSGDVEYRPAATVSQVYRALRSGGRRDIVHAHMTAAELPAAVLKHRLRARLVVTRHFVSPRGRSWPGRVAARLVESRMDAQISISRLVAAATPSPSTVIYNGVSCATEEHSARGRAVVVLQRLEPEKDTATALRAWATSGLAEEGWRLLVYGRGREELQLRRLAADLGVAQSVFFGGFTSAPRPAIAQAGMVLATALAEPFGLAVVEAMAEGTPVVATRAGAHPETLGDDGCYFAPGDAAGCAAELVRLAADESERRARGERLRERQRACFSIATHVDRLEAEYERLLAGAPTVNARNGQ